MSKKYRVVKDLQGGEFGMGRDYTAKEWLEQAVDWRDSDDSWGDYGEGVDCYGNKHLDSRSWFIKFWQRMIKDGKEQELINYIADIWQIEFEEVKEPKVRVILEWDGDKANLLDEDNGMSLGDNINHALDYGSEDSIIYHNDIRIKVERGA